MSIVTLTNGTVSASLNSFGAELISLKNSDGKEYLWQGDSTYWSGQAPILFPIVGCLRNGTATLKNGKTCTLGRHGIARKQEFKLISSTEASATFSLQANDTTLQQYPFKFELQITYLLCNQGITVEHKITNHDSNDMPYSVGGHPAFHCPVNDNENFEDYIVTFEYKETASCPQISDDGLIIDSQMRSVLNNEDTIPMKHSLFYKDALVFDQLKSRQVSLLHKDTRHGIQLTFKDFDYLGVWSSANDGPFVALEPWSGTATLESEDDIFEHKRGIKILSPKDTETLNYTIDIV